jgi:hypothetical protein
LELPEIAPEFRPAFIVEDPADVGALLYIDLDSVKIMQHRGRIRPRKELEVKCNLYRDERNEPACDGKPAL